MNEKHTLKVNDILHRVEGQYTDDGSETYQGMELAWEQWQVEKVTPRGAWLRSVEWPHKKLRFALIPGARWVSGTKEKALVGLIARKRRQLEIIRQQNTTATETLSLAQSALAEITQRAAQAAKGE